MTSIGGQPDTEPDNDDGSETADEVCIANGTGWGSRPNPLMTPECTCSACQKREAERLAAVAAERAEQREWLRASGGRRRRRVGNVPLGSRGREALG